MAIIVNGDGILTGVSSLATALTDLTSGRGTVTGVATVGTLQLGAGVSMGSPRSQNAAIFTNNSEFLTVDDAGRVGVGTVTPNSDAHPQNVGKINVGFITARSVAGDIDANTLVVAGISTFVGALNATLTGTASGNAVLTGSTNNQLVTVTGANAITGEANLTFDGNALSQTIDANDEGINITASGAHAIRLKYDSNPSSADDTIYFQSARWNGTEIASIHMRAGADTTNKDDGRITFHTTPSGGSITEALRIDSSGKVAIGNASPQQLLHVWPDTANTTSAYVRVTAGDRNSNTGIDIGHDASGNGQVNVVSNGTLTLSTNNSPRIKIANSSAATSIGGSNVFNAMLTVQGDISGQLLNLKATEGTTRLMVSGTDGNGCEMNLYDAAGAQRGIMGVSSSECFVTAPASGTALNLKGYSEVRTQNYHTNGSAGYLERWKVYQHGTSLQPSRHGDSVETKSGGRYYVLSGATPLDGSNTSATDTPLMRCGHSYNGVMYLWMAFNGDQFHRGCRQMIIDCQGTYGYISNSTRKSFYQNALGAGLNSLNFGYQNSGSPNYYFKVNGTWAGGQSDIPYILWTWVGHNSAYPYAL